MKKNEYQIDKRIPITLRGVQHTKFPFNNMEINDSFLVPVSDYTSEPSMRQKLMNSIASFNASNNKNYKVSIRKCDEGMRVWRIK